MSEGPRYTINRSVIILRHKQPFLDWLMRVDPEPDPGITLADLDQDGDAFLLPDEPVIDTAEDAVRWVEKRWRMFFEHALYDWFTDESLWPEKRTLKMFREWFDIDYRSMVWDLAKEPIEQEDWDAPMDPSDALH